jgi:hypothetical protein
VTCGSDTGTPPEPAHCGRPAHYRSSIGTTPDTRVPRPGAEIDEIVGSLAVARVPVAAAAEGMVLTL